MKPRTGSALITGGGRRLGQAMGLALAARGYDLVIHYRSSAQGAHQLQADADLLGAKTHLIQGDLSQPAFMESLIPKAKALAPDLNLLINNASIFYPQNLAQTDLETLDAFMNLHLKAPLILTRDFARDCGAGQIINMVDTQVQKNPIDYLPYILSKKSLTDLTYLSAKALGPDIRVNAIAPGYILPPIEGNIDQSETWIKGAPMKRMGAITDITAALESLLDNSFLTGQVLWVDGGFGL